MVVILLLSSILSGEASLFRTVILMCILAYIYNVFPTTWLLLATLPLVHAVLKTFDNNFRTMGAATALRNVFDADTTRNILSFVDDSSLVTTYDSESSDIANLNDVGGRYEFVLEAFYNRSLQRGL